jgi:hypothetical protein
MCSQKNLTRHTFFKCFHLYKEGNRNYKLMRNVIIYSVHNCLILLDITCELCKVVMFVIMRQCFHAREDLCCGLLGCDTA